MGVTYMLQGQRVKHLRELLPESVADSYSDDEILAAFSDLL